MAGLDHRDTVTHFEMQSGTFFDIGVVHLLTTATIDRLRALYPQGPFETRRFRPNIVVATPEEDQGFVEIDWVGRTMTVGGKVRLAITEPCPRCVVITLPQGDLPKDSGILRTAARQWGERRRLRLGREWRNHPPRRRGFSRVNKPGCDTAAGAGERTAGRIHCETGSAPAPWRTLSS